MVLYCNPVQKELIFRTLDRVHAYELIKNFFESVTRQPLTTNEELRQATLDLYLSASEKVDEGQVRIELENVNKLLDKLIGSFKYNNNEFKGLIIDLTGDRRQNSNLRDVLPYMAKDLEGKLREFVTLLSSNGNIPVTEQDKRESNISVTEPNNHNIEKAHTCLICSGSFTSKRKDSKYCSSRCKQIAYRERKESA